VSSAAVWHEVECGGYSADLETWERLAGAAGEGGILELGCGLGRVALHLARRGHELWAVDADPTLLTALAAQASRERLGIQVACADVRALALDRDFELIIAPMQLVQMLGGTAARRVMLTQAATHLSGAGRLAAAIVELPATSLAHAAAALPDVRERRGWVYSSLPTIVPMAGGDLEIRRLRQAVSPDGSLSEEDHVDRLDTLDADRLEAEAETSGLRPLDRLDVPAAEGYLGATVVVLERA
jgi:SAM-dependent methyltransferase